jgi:serine/threonine protein phosphatase 1
MEHPVVPAGHVVYAVGDIHGRADLLALLLDQIKADAAASVGAKKKTLVFVGDYIDRGPESRCVVDLLLGALPTGFDTHFLKGNHEEMMFEFLEDPSSLGYWLGNGGAATLESYGVDVTGLRRDAAKPEAWRDAFLSALPEQHRRFFESLELTASFGDYLFVHAGIRPGVPLKAQNPQDLLWIRGEFLRSEEDFGKVVVHGHTPKDAPEIRANRIGIDTGAFFSNRLTALRLQEGSRRFLQAEAAMPTTPPDPMQYEFIDDLGGSIEMH